MSAMKHYLCRTILYLLIFTVLILTPDAESDSDCSTEIRVRRNTVYNASAGQQLWINCPVFFCNDSPTTVTWYKVEEAIVPVDVSGDSHIKTELKPLNKSVWIFYLIFQNILRHDSGQYQCQGGGSMGHAITVNVYDHAEITTITQNNLTVSTTSVPDNTETLLLYVYSAAGITTFVIIVIIISVISMRGCKGKPKKDSQVENQQMEIPMVDQFFSKVIFKHLERGKRKTLCSAISEM
ncbi:B- and T-lymphocyte attenuator-like isoform X2 [Astatotilapia calliptera]|uniref:B- and T-lymphocyte attenuator-like isoform X2 n=1 Tax=Astatotilapia calliptera TaxID=8154 RepID=UPI000E420DA6|nr:B- and T-lymphocyte attenuator-like isoform X2 [Astatotilapia calliptera]